MASTKHWEHNTRTRNFKTKTKPTSGSRLQPGDASTTVLQVPVGKPTDLPKRGFLRLRSSHAVLGSCELLPDFLDLTAQVIFDGPLLLHTGAQAACNLLVRRGKVLVSREEFAASMPLCQVSRRSTPAVVGLLPNHPKATPHFIKLLFSCFIRKDVNDKIGGLPVKRAMQ